MVGSFERRSKMTLAMAIGLMGPHTWAASIIPTLLACVLAYARCSSFSASMAICLLIICILLQSATNVLDDYFDFKKGVDSETDNLERSDAVLIYNDMDPKYALWLAICILIAAFILGIYPVVYAGVAPLIIAFIGACIVLLYSGGKTPISYLPIGEIISGFTMGGLMCFACYTVLTRTLEPLVFVWSIPAMLGIALIMQTNNTCDIEKDREAGRRTLPVLIGRERSRLLYKALCSAWAAIIALNVAIWFSAGIIILPFAFLALIPVFKGMLSNPLSANGRIAAMNAICVANISIGAFYACTIFASQITLML